METTTMEAFLDHVHIQRFMFLLDEEHILLSLVSASAVVLAIILGTFWIQTSVTPVVPKKNLPRRPLLVVHFRPEQEEPLSSSSAAVAAIVGTTDAVRQQVGRPKKEHDKDDDDDDDECISREGRAAPQKASSSPWRRRLSSFHGEVKSMTRQIFSGRRNTQKMNLGGAGCVNVHDDDDDDDDDDDLSDREDEIILGPVGTDKRNTTSTLDDDLLLDSDDDNDHSVRPPNSTIPAFVVETDLPDSFAPLLSSSHVEIARSNLTADLVHACAINASIRLRCGRHEIPLNKDESRPQFILDVPEGGCRFSVSSLVGSDGFDDVVAQDLNPSIPTALRTKPLVKQACITLDPPLPLANVAPTLIHFPSLFVDKLVTRLRRFYVFSIVIDFIVSVSSYLERCLWLVESKCQIHLSKAQMIPVYKGYGHGSKPTWHLCPAFSGHVLVFGWIPIPFISVILPSFIIPHPHALLDSLLSKQPFASARLKRENIAHERIVIAALEPVEKWTAEVTLLATPPAVGIDITLPGGLSVALEMGLGRDPTAQSKAVSSSSSYQVKRTAGGKSPARGMTRSNSLSSWSTNQQFSAERPGSIRTNDTSFKYDANKHAPWLVDFKAKGTCSHEKLAFHLVKFSLSQSQKKSTSSTAKEANHVNGGGSFSATNSKPKPQQHGTTKENCDEDKDNNSRFSATGSFAIWKIPPGDAATRGQQLAPISLTRSSSWGRITKRALSGRPALDESDSPSVAAILLFPEETTAFHRYLKMLQYDYAFDVAPNSRFDAVTLSVGANHPLLKGGTTITAILDSIYAFGSATARDDAILDPLERKRKRNILYHLPVIDFNCGVQNIYIPPESTSYSDDGQTLFLPELEGGRMMLRFLGGTDEKSADGLDTVSKGIMVLGDIEVTSFNMKTEGAVNEFPELDVYEGTKLRTNLSGSISGRLVSHLRPQAVTSKVVSAGPNIFNPLEAYEIDFSGTNLSAKLREYAAVLGHRRIILPAESAFVISIIESVVDMGFEGKTLCELSWDFQGLSPILQVAPPGQSPETVQPESKQQVSLLIGPLRQGRFSLQVSSVGGIQVKKAATSRDHKEGLYDWKFFNALVSPDDSSAQRILDVLHDQRTMEKFLQVVKLVNEELYNIMEYSLQQVWRAKKILDAEGVSDPGHAIPLYKMARLISLFLTGDVHEVSTILPLVRRVIEGDGLDTVTVKELLRKHLPRFEDWAPELDRALRWTSILLGPMAVSPGVAGQDVTPLAEVPHHAERFKDIPTAQQLYRAVLEKPQLPLDPVFSKLVSRVAPYLSFRQIEYLLGARSPTDWQQSDLRRLRYVYSIKKKVLEIAESYGGFSFLPQSFLVSVFLGEATKSSLKISDSKPKKKRTIGSVTSGSRRSFPLRRQRIMGNNSDDFDGFVLSPAQRAASFKNMSLQDQEEIILEYDAPVEGLPGPESYQLGDSLLGPQDVAILLQSGLTSVMKSSTVVQLNQRMLLDLICSQPHSFAVAVLAEIGSPSGEGSPRSLTSALMSLLELDQTAFTDRSKIDMHALLESWLPGLKVPRRDDYMAGGRWARQSYYEAIFSVATSILEDAESYMALKGHLQRVRHNKETDPIPGPLGTREQQSFSDDGRTRKYETTLSEARNKIAEADGHGYALIDSLIEDTENVKSTEQYQKTIDSYRDAFASCASLLELDRYAFQLEWFRSFYLRNYEALMIKSMYDNVVDGVDDVRHWLQALRNGSTGNFPIVEGAEHFVQPNRSHDTPSIREADSHSVYSEGEWETLEEPTPGDGLFIAPESRGEQVLVDAIIEATIYNETDKDRLKRDPLVRLLIPNPEGVHYDFAIVSAMGVITEGEKGLELKNAFERLERNRGVIAIRAGTGTARSLEYNAGKIEQAIEHVVKMKKPYGLLGYSQGCANALLAETIMNSGSPKQNKKLQGLVCRQLLFSAANGSVHGPSMEAKIRRLIILCEEFFKYQQGYVSRALASTVLALVTDVLDSNEFHKFMGGAQSFLRDGCRAFWREGQHLAHVPTCTLRGVLEPHTTPECLEMISHLLTKQSGSKLHDSQVHAFDAVGHPIYHRNRNGRILERCDVGEGSIQRTHHWSPLSDEVEFVRTKKDIEQGSFECAKDRHVVPWVEVNARFGFIKPLKQNSSTSSTVSTEAADEE